MLIIWIAITKLTAFCKILYFIMFALLIMTLPKVEKLIECDIAGRSKKTVLKPFIVCSIIYILASISAYGLSLISTTVLEAESSVTEALIVNVEHSIEKGATRRKHRRRRTLYYEHNICITYKFTDAKGEEFISKATSTHTEKFKYDCPKGSNIYIKGQKANVRYLNNNPNYVYTENYISDELSYNSGDVIYQSIILGMLTIVIPSISLYVKYKKYS